MKLHTCLFSLAVPLTVAACSGGDSDKRLADLTLEESQDLCRDFAADHPIETFTCPGETEARTRGVDPADCEGPDAEIGVPDTCTATVGQLEACENKLYSLSDDEVCNLTALPSECAFLASADCTEPDPTPRTSVVDVVSRLRGAVLR